VNKEDQLVNVRLNKKLWHKVKVAAVVDGKTITQWLSELIEIKVGKG
jgi:predicted DNA binding CopG/RHH family protein